MKVGERARANFHTQHNRGKSKVYYQTGEFIRMDMVNDTECLHAWNEEGARGQGYLVTDSGRGSHHRSGFVDPNETAIPIFCSDLCELNGRR